MKARTEDSRIFLAGTSTSDFIFMSKAEEYDAREGRFLRQKLYTTPGAEAFKREELLPLAKEVLEAAIGPAKYSTEIVEYGNSLVWEPLKHPGVVVVSETESLGTSTASISIRSFELGETGLLDMVVASFLGSGKFTLNSKGSEDVSVEYAFPAANGSVVFYGRNFIQEPLDSIEMNYTPEVVEQTRYAIKQIQGVASGLLVLNGPPGTGKTHLIRAILTETAENRVPIVCNPPLEFLSSMGLMAHAITSFDASLLVLEDLGDVLTKTAATEHIQIYSNLLNITDGLLSLLSNAVVLLTFNTDIGKINEAVLRPGRCIAHIEVGELPVEKARELLLADGIDVQLDKKEYTLAEVYEIKRLGGLPKKRTEFKKSMGLLG